ncbi:MAG: 50S ribosomal protein L10 [Myxococcota bacterium]
MLRAEKEQSVEALTKDVARSQAVLFVDYTGLTVEEVTNLRKKFRAQDIGFRVVKNTLMKRAIAGTPYEGASKVLKGTPTGVVLGFKDPVATAKSLYEALKEMPEHLKVKGGIFENKAITAKEAEALSKMPSREELLGQIIGMALGVGSKVLGQIKNPAGRIVGAIETKAKEESK